MAEIKKGDSLEQAISNINKEIDGRRAYGVRVESLPSRKLPKKLHWLNGPAEWWPSNPDMMTKCKCEAGVNISDDLAIINKPWCIEREEGVDTAARFNKRAAAYDNIRQAKCVCTRVPHETQCLDANEILVTGLSMAVLREMAPVLNQLPLYSGSFEARSRGEFKLSGIGIPPGLKKAWIESELGGIPLDIQSQIAIEGKMEEN